MNLRTGFLIWILSNAPVPAAHAQFIIQGSVTDIQHKPVPYAMITLENREDNSLLKTEFSDTAGGYLISVSTLRHMDINVAAMGFSGQKITISDTTDPFQVIDFRLEEAINILSDVAVTSRKPLFERKMDRTVFNVANSVSATGSNALETLQKAPAVTLDPVDQHISLAGKGAVRIMINGRLLQISGDDLTAYLQSIPSENIERIEVISMPPAQYDASGSSGLIDIILKKDKKAGANGMLQLGYEQASYGKVIGGSSFHFRKDKLDLYAHADYAHAVNAIIERLNTSYAESAMHMTDRHTRTLQPFSYTIGADYEIHQNGILGLELTANDLDRRDNENIINRVIPYVTAEVDSLMNTIGFYESTNRNHALNLNYEWQIDTSGKKLIWNANRLWFSSRHGKDFETQHYLGEFDAPTSVHTKNKIGSDLGINITAFQVDMELPYAWATLSLGGKWSIINNHSANHFQYFDAGYYHDDPAISSSFTYTEQVQALYASAQRSWKKWAVQLGLRGEFTQTKGYSFNLDQTNTNRYAQLFPTAYLQYKINPEQELSLSYSRRINRPGYRDLDPFRSYSSPYFYSEGNPFLRPFFSNAFELNYSLHNRYYFSAFCRMDKNSSNWNAWVVDTAAGITHALAGNFFNITDYGVSVMVNLDPAAWWELQSQAYLTYSKVSSEFYSGSMQLFRAPYVYLYAGNVFYLNRAKTVLAELNGFYRSRSRSGFFEWEAGWGANAGLKVLLRDKRIVLALNASNLFRNRNISAFNQVTGQTLNNDLDLQNIRLTCIFKFGSKNNKAVRTRKTGLEDEKTRM